MREILRDASGDRAIKKMAQRKLDAVGYITAHAEFANSPAKMKRMGQALELDKSLAEIARIDAAEDKAKKGRTRQRVARGRSRCCEKVVFKR